MIAESQFLLQRMADGLLQGKSNLPFGLPLLAVNKKYTLVNRTRLPKIRGGKGL